MYHLEFNGEQAKVIIAALDVYTRLHMGQVGIAAEVLSEGSFTSEQIEVARLYCKDIKISLGLPINGSFGISHQDVPRRGKIAHDVNCVIRQVVARIEKHGVHSVWHQDPTHCVPDVPLATCTSKASQNNEILPNQAEE